MQVPNIMGILNLTPDSFSDGGKYVTIDSAIAHAEKLMCDGADIIDVGGESTRPGCTQITQEEELRRIIPVVKKLQDYKIPISIDTYKPNVAKACLDFGAKVINDVSGLKHQDMAKIAAEYKVPVVIMHSFDESFNEIKAYLSQRIAYANHCGVSEIIIDPGIGFKKTGIQNFEILNRLNELYSLYCPILIGPSKKSFIKNNKQLTTFQALVLGIKNGANIIRVHDVLLAKEAIRVAQKLP